jgi:hypothetical protein
MSSSEIDYKSLSFFDVGCETDEQFLDKILKGENKLANKIRTTLHQDINKEGFEILLSDEDIYSKKLLNVLTKMLEAKNVILEYKRSMRHGGLCLDISYKESK